MQHPVWIPAKDIRHIIAVYIGVALLLLAILTSMYHYANKLFVDSEMSRWNAQMDRGISTLSNTLIGIDNAMNAIRSGDTFLSLRYHSSSQLNLVNLMEQQRILKGYFMQQNAVLSAGLVFNEEFVLTMEWIFYPGSRNCFYPAMFHCGNMTFDEWLTALQDTGKAFLPMLSYSSQVFSGVDALTYTMPWGTNATMYALIRAEELNDMFLPDDADPSISLILTRGDGTLLYQHGPQAQKNSHTLCQIVNVGDITATLSIPNTVINSNLHHLRQMVILYIAVILLIAIVLTLLFACFITAKPLSVLSAKLPESSASGNEKTLSSNYRRLEDGISFMGQMISSQRAAMAQQLMELALFRGFLSDEEKQELMRLVPDFPMSYRLVLYRLGDGTTAEQRTHAMELCSKTFPHCPLYTLDHDGILLVSNAQFHHREEAAYVHEEINRQLGLFAHAVSSEIHEGLDSLHDAWTQIFNINCCAQAGDADHMLTTRDLPEKRIVMPLSIQDLQTIYDAINSANLPLALSVLENCTNQLLLREHNTRLYQHTHIMIQRVLHQLQLENPIALGHLTIPAYVSENRNEIFAASLPECFDEFCEALRKSRSGIARNSSIQILEYINIHLSSSSLCVDSIASHFGVSSTTLQKLLKETTGSTVAAYIETQRLNKAYKLLTQTNAAIAQVAQECGFNSPNSFYKAFKRSFGTAPRSVGESDFSEAQESSEREEKP